MAPNRGLMMLPIRDWMLRPELGQGMPYLPMGAPRTTGGNGQSMPMGGMSTGGNLPAMGAPWQTGGNQPASPMQQWITGGNQQPQPAMQWRTGGNTPAVRRGSGMGIGRLLNWQLPRWRPNQF